MNPNSQSPGRPGSPAGAGVPGPARRAVRTRNRRVAFIAILLAAFTVAALLGSELALRAFDRPDPGNLPTFYADAPTYYSYRHDFHYDWPNEDGVPISVSTDENGFRNPRGYLSGCEAILLGDSFIAGINTPEDRTLAGLLRARGMRVYNAGVDMFSSGQALQVLKALQGLRDRSAKAKTQAGTGEDPKLKTAVLAFYQGNDFRDNYFAKPVQSVQAASGSPAAAGFKSLYFSLAEKSLLLRTFHNRIYLGLIKGRAADPMASFTLSEMSAYRRRYGAEMDRAVAKTDSILGEFAAEAGRSGIRLLILGIPSKAAVLRSFKEIAMYEKEPRARDFALESIRQGYSFDKPDSVAGALARKHGLPYLSLLPAFRKSLDLSPYYRLDTHWREAGEKIAADTLWEALRTLE